MAEIDAAIAERAAQQLGLITVQQAHELGATRPMLRSRIRGRRLARLSPKVLRVAGAPSSWRQQVLAAVLEAGPGAVASHRTAAALWRFDGAVRGVVEVTVPRGRRPRRVEGTLHTAHQLLGVDVDSRPLIPRTTPTRTLLDCAAVVPYAVLESMVDSSMRDGLVRDSYIRWRISQLPGRRGVRDIERILGPAGPSKRAQSWLERRALRVFAAAGIPPPRVQVQMGKRGGPYRVDFIWEEAGLVVEVLGHRTHSVRRALQSDAERRTRLELAGWVVREFTYEDVVERPDHVAAIVLASLGIGVTRTDRIARSRSRRSST